MAVLRSAAVPGSENFLANEEAHLALLSGVRELEAKVRARSDKMRGRFEERGQILPRERLARLLDPGAPWLEFSTLAGLGMHDDDGKDDVHGAGVITGIGEVAGVRTAILVSDSGIKGGTIAPMGLEKTLRLYDIALENKLPVIYLVESGGANLQYQAEIFVKGGGNFYRQGLLSAAGIPQIVVVHGNSTAGGAYVPGMADYSIMVEGGARVFLAGPPLLKAATGEVATEEDLGGAAMHTAVSGVGDFFVRSDAEGIALAREVMGRIAWNDGLSPECAKTYREPEYDPAEILGCVPVDFRKPFDVREVIARLADGSDFTDFKPRYGVSTVCGWSEIEGFAVAFVGNNGPIDPEGAQKSAQFMQLCAQAGTPIVYLTNTTGFLVGTKVEQQGIIKHGSKMIQAVANAPVPKITLNIGASYGAGNYAMCGRAFHPRFLFAWPNARVAVMGGAQAGKVLRIVTEAKLKRSGQEVDTAKVEAMEKGVADMVEGQSDALYYSARLHDDGIIDPRDTRRLLGLLLSVCREADRRVVRPNTFGIGRM